MMRQGERLLITPVKPIDGLSARWDHILRRAAKWPDHKPFRLAVVGGGAGEGLGLGLGLRSGLGLGFGLG